MERALLGNHTDADQIATICTVSSGVASQHPKCGAVPPIRRPLGLSGWRQPAVE
jgi:hypothetical protein